MARDLAHASPLARPSKTQPGSAAHFRYVLSEAARFDRTLMDIGISAAQARATDLAELVVSQRESVRLLIAALEKHVSSLKDERARTVAFLGAETRRYEAEVLADVETTLLPTGDAPDAELCELVRAERDRIRAFGKLIERHASRPRGAR